MQLVEEGCCNHVRLKYGANAPLKSVPTFRHTVTECVHNGRNHLVLERSSLKEPLISGCAPPDTQGH